MVYVYDIIVQKQKSKQTLNLFSKKQYVTNSIEGRAISAIISQAGILSSGGTMPPIEHKILTPAYDGEKKNTVFVKLSEIPISQHTHPSSKHNDNCHYNKNQTGNQSDNYTNPPCFQIAIGGLCIHSRVNFVELTVLIIQYQRNNA